ncbi:MAG: cysteine synthase A [Gammaproteobacteria bacterium]|nr:MAG: cysteine synthase A [Gammaproteobacteria bacterium]
MPRYDNILDTIGNTPLVRLNRLVPEGVNVYAKVESFNPMGSVKDRMARAIIERAEQSGELQPGQTVIEATSGNTGIGLAMVCAQKGYPLVVTMAENFSIERRKMLRFLGAKVVLTPASEMGTGMLNKAVELAEKHGYYFCQQFENEANAQAHSQTTAREILQDFEDDSLDYFVSGFGTGGTILGVARTLKAADPAIRIVAAEPDNSPVLGSGIPQPRDANGSIAGTHPYFRPHLMQGWGPNFISGLTQQAVDNRLIDEILPVSGDDAMTLSRRLAREEGIFAGTSSGATLAAALEIAHRSPTGTNIVCMLPDTGERYLSTPLFEDIGEEMDAEELAISQSTAGCRFDSADADAVAPAASVPVRIDPFAEEFFRNITENQPVVMFSLEWCEFSWSARKLFSRLGVDYHSVDLDSVEFQQEDFGDRIREVLEQRTGSPTIPQIFIGGRHIGGATELFDATRDGSMQALYRAHGIDFDQSVNFDPYELMPKWLQPRKSA